jgi:RHS repeat-associated protein
VRRALLAGIVAALAAAAPAAAASKPDLTVTAIKPGATTLGAGAKLAVQGTVRDAGKGKAAKTTVELVLSLDSKRDAKDKRLGTLSIKALKAKKSVTFKGDVLTTVAPGRYVLLACVDPAKKVRESKETNNCRAAAARVTITAPTKQPPVPTPTPTPAAGPSPVPVDSARRPPQITSGPSGTVAANDATFTFTGAGPFECRLDAGAYAACTSPQSYSGLPGGAHGFDVRSLVGADHRDWTAAFEAPAPGPTDAAAPDPAPRAPAVVAGETTLIGDSTKFLYTGADPIQPGVAADAISPLRAAVLRGSVQTRMGTPIAGVRVAVLDHPEYGHTDTRADGGFDMAVEGGGVLTITLARAGYVPVQRQVEPRSQDYDGVDAITMIPYDDTVTGIDPATATAPEVVQSSPVTDAAGTRRATLLFEPGTDATAKLADGSVRALPDELNVRATEYTIGATGPSAMPGQLPPSSGYTYAVEYSVDEADALGAVDVRFDKPVVTYVDDFLGFAAGTAVPAGYYDRAAGHWVASKNGLVIKLVGESGGLADVDITGDGTADGAAALAAVGIDDAERARLAQLYDPGKSLWRVEVSHFTPWDYNYPYGPPDGAGPPGQDGPNGPDGPGDGGCNSGGSVIGCEEQTLGEELAVAGTPYTLRYASDRVPGRRTDLSLNIPLTGATPPLPLAHVDLTVEVAGRTFHSIYSAAANQKAAFNWDGKDAYGRTVLGRQPIHTSIAYAYPAVYRAPDVFQQSFALLGGAPISGNANRTEISASQDWTGSIGGIATPPSAIGGWGLDVHHTYDPVGRTLYMGDGTRRSADGQNFDVISTVVGAASTGAATVQALDGPEGLVKDPDGALLIADTGANVIRKVTAAGVASVVAGTGDAGFAGDGGPAIDAELDHPADVALGPDGSIYVADEGNERVRRIGTDGVIRTIAGSGEAGYSGNGGPATDARFDTPSDVAVAADGTVYVIDQANDALRRIGTDGTVTAVVGRSGAPGFSGDGGPAAAAKLRTPRDVALGPDGAIFIADAGNHRVREIDAGGTITTVAGNGSGAYGGDGGPATDAALDTPSAVAPTADGGFAIADAGNAAIRLVAADGTITTVAGTLLAGATGDGGPATRARIDFPQALLAGDGLALTFVDASTDRVRQIAPTMPGLAIGEYTIPSTNGDDLFVFTAEGRHLRTLDALTGATLLSFGYDGAGRLTSVTDDKARKTTIERDAAGNPTAIVGPYGHRTTLQTDANGYLSQVTDPIGTTVGLKSTADGLLTQLTDPRDGVHKFAYDEVGRLTSDDNGSSGAQTLSRAVSGSATTITRTTAAGRVSTYRTETLADGRVKSTITDGVGGTTVAVVALDGTTTVTEPDGTRQTYRFEPDPRFGMSAPLPASITTETPGGHAQTIASRRTVQLGNPGDPLSLTSLTQVDSINGRASTMTYTAADQKLVTTSAGGSPSVTDIDGARRPLHVTLPGQPAVTMTYDADGRIVSRVQGTRSWTYTYNAQGLNDTATDPDQRVTHYVYDADGRVVQRILPGNRVIALTYDKFGSVDSLTPPSQPAHALTYTPQGLIESYTAPTEPAMALGYDADDNLTSIKRPGEAAATLTYDAGARLTSIVEPDGTVTFGYADGSSNQSKVTAPGETLDLTYDGSLPVSDTFSGASNGVVARTYDDELRLAGTTVHGGSAVAFGYDLNGLLTSAGDLRITRDGGGYVTATALGAVTSADTSDGYGEPSGQTYSGPGGTVYDGSTARDDAGLITQESALGTTTSYLRDDVGRLTKATTGPHTVEYAYDDNGNRTSRIVDGGSPTIGAYNSQDQLTQWGDTAYAYRHSGELLTKTAPGGVTTYGYDARGNLLSVLLPGSHHADYTADGRDRRVAMAYDGTVTDRFVYGEALGPSAEVDASGNVVTRFVYARRSNVPDYMVRGGVTYRFVLDSRGSVRLVVNAATGAIAQRLDYDEYGVVTADTSPGFQPFGFGGGLYDPHTGLVRLGARDYDATVGRFIAKDPLGFDGGSTNLYAYANDDPVSAIDPSGEFIPLIIGAAIVGGGLVNGAIEGIKSAIHGCSTGQILGAAGRGFVAGSVGTAVGIGVGEIPVVGPWLAGAAGGATTEFVSQALGGGDYDVGAIAVGAAVGAVPFGKWGAPTRGFEPNVWRPRGPGTSLTYGPNSQRIIGQAAIDTGMGNLIGTDVTGGIKRARGCPAMSC